MAATPARITAAAIQRQRSLGEGPDRDPKGVRRQDPRAAAGRQGPGDHAAALEHAHPHQVSGRRAGEPRSGAVDQRAARGEHRRAPRPGQRLTAQASGESAAQKSHDRKPATEQQRRARLRKAPRDPHGGHRDRRDDQRHRAAGEREELAQIAMRVGLYRKKRIAHVQEGRARQSGQEARPGEAAKVRIGSATAPCMSDKSRIADPRSAPNLTVEVQAACRAAAQSPERTTDGSLRQALAPAAPGVQWRQGVGRAAGHDLALARVRGIW